jgi:hypothetical protein
MQRLRSSDRNALLVAASFHTRTIQCLLACRVYGIEGYWPGYTEDELYFATCKTNHAFRNRTMIRLTKKNAIWQMSFKVRRNGCSRKMSRLSKA